MLSNPEQMALRPIELIGDEEEWTFYQDQYLD
jgi:hypothetical protein